MMLLKPYKLVMKTTVVVMANNARHAEMIARANRREIERDSELEPGIATAVNSLADLSDEWDGDCIPYGGDGNTRLKELLPPNARNEGPELATVPLENTVRGENPGKGEQ